MNESNIEYFLAPFQDPEFRKWHEAIKKKCPIDIKRYYKSRLFDRRVSDKINKGVNE